MTQWVDVDSDDDDQPNGGSPFGVAPVDKIAYIDDDSAVELRGGDVMAGVEKPQPRTKPTPRKPTREKRWMPADEPPAPKIRRGGFGKFIRALVAIALFAGIGYAGYWVVTTYQQSVVDPTPPPSSSIPITR